MVSLYINGKLADLKLNTPIPYTYRFDSVDIPGAIRTGSSRTITLPGTLNNSILFGGIDKVQSAGFNASVKAEYELLNNGQRVNRGYLQLVNISKDPLEFEVVLFDELGDFFNKLKDKKVVELPLNVTHNINANYLKTLWTRQDTLNDVEYIPMLQGFYSGFDSNKYSVGDSLTEFPVNYNEWEIAKFSSIKQKPALRALTLLNALKSEYNINFTDVLNDPLVQSLYVTGLNLQERGEGVQLVNYSKLKSSNIIPFSGRNIENRTLTFTGDDPLGILIKGLPNLEKYYNKEIDIDANVAITISDVIVRSEALDLSGITEYELHPTSRPDFPRPTLRYNLDIDDQQLSILCNDYRLRYEYGRWEPIFFNSTDILDASFVKKLYPKVNNVGSEFSFLNVWDYKVWNLRTNQYEDFLVNALEVSYNISVGVNYKARAKTDVVFTGTQVVFERLLPKDLTQFDFLVNLAKQLGWVFYFDDLNSQIVICKRKDYYFNVIDNLTVIKRNSIKPLVFDKNKLIFGYKENTSNSFFNEYKDKTGNNYCDKLVNTGYEFNSEKQRYFGSTPFESPIVIDYSFNKLIPQGNNVYNTQKTTLRLPLLASLKDKEYEYSACNLQLYFKNGYIDYDYQIFDELVTDKNQTYRDGLVMTTMPLFSNIKGNMSLDYGKPEVSFTTLTDEEYPESYTLFDQRFKSYIIDRYNVDSRLYSCEIYIELNKILDNAGRKFYYLDNSYWIIQAIEDYDYANPGRAKVKLLKVKDINNYIL